MKDLAALALDEARRLGADYADFRHQQDEAEAVYVKNGRCEGIQRSSSSGFGIRVLVAGSWGFSSSCNLSRESIARTVRRAVALAREAAKTQKGPVRLDDSPIAETTYETPIRRDPFSVPIPEKIGLLEEAHRNMSAVRGVFMTHGQIQSWRKRQFLQVLDHAPAEQTIIECGAGIAAFATEGTQLQRRSYPNSHGGNVATAGFEFVEEMNLPEHATSIAEEAVALIRAPDTPEGEFPLVIGSAQLALQIHESVGHPTELDRILGTEISFAGGSWIKPEDVGRVRYGSEAMNIVCDATLPRGLGTFAFDDEGVPARKYHLVKNGVLLDALSSRESAARIGRRSTGAMRAESWNRIPLVRMTNVSLEPGRASLDELLSGIDRGIYVDVNKSWSIDDRRLNFQFATEYAREIRNGRLAGLLKNPIYQGIGPEFWADLQACGNASTWKLWGVPNCGKGQPMQSAHVGHGAPVGLFRKVRVGTAK